MFSYSRRKACFIALNLENENVGIESRENFEKMVAVTR